MLSPTPLLALSLLLIYGSAHAQRAISGANIQRYANGVLGLMGYTVAPDVTTSSLSISNAESDNPGITMVQLGGGATLSKETPLYLEGNAAYSRYDPTFIASNGTETRLLPLRWNSFSATGGVGWDITVAPNWVVRPIFNFTLGTVASDLRLAKWWIDNNTNLDLQFANNGRLNAYGLGGALMLDYELFTPEHDVDFEARYSNVQLRSFSGTSEAVKGESTAASVGLYGRWRAPTEWRALDRPVRYVIETAVTRFVGPDAGLLGFDQLYSVGAGLELDSSAYDVYVTRTRLVARYKFGPNVSGVSVGLAMSF